MIYEYLGTDRSDKIIGNKVKEFILITILFIIFPILSLPLILIAAYNQRKYSYFYISVILGLVSMYYYPQGDQFRYLEYFKLYKNKHFNELFDFDLLITYRNFNLITITLFLASKISIFTLELYRFCLVTIASLTGIYIYKNIIKSIKDNISFRQQFIFFLIILLATPVYYISQGFRSGFGAVILCYAIYCLLNHKKIGYFWILIASFIHLSFIPISILYITAININWKISKRNFLLIFFSIFIAVIFAVSFLYSAVPFVKMTLDVYLYGEYGSEFVWDAYSIKEIVLINGIPMIIMYFLFIRSDKNEVDYRFSNLLYVNLMLVLICLPFQTFTQRLGIISLLILSLYTIRYYKSMRTIKYSQIIILSLFLSFTYPFFMHRYYYHYAHIENILISPLPLILQNNYDQTETYILLDDIGILKDQYKK